MALGSYFTKAKKKVVQVAKTAGSYIMKPIDAAIERDKAMVEARKDRDAKMIREAFGSQENYDKLQEEEKKIAAQRAAERNKQKNKNSYIK